MVYPYAVLRYGETGTPPSGMLLSNLPPLSFHPQRDPSTRYERHVLSKVAACDLPNGHDRIIARRTRGSIAAKTTGYSQSAPVTDASVVTPTMTTWSSSKSLRALLWS